MSEELSRDALLIYLEDLRTLETIKHESTLSCARIEADVDKNKKIAEETKKAVPIEPQKPPYRQQKNVVSLIIASTFFIGIGIWFAFSFGLTWYEEFRYNEYDTESVSRSAFGFLFIVGIPIVIGLTFIHCLKKGKKDVAAYNAKVNDYYYKATEDYKKKVGEYNRLVARKFEIVSQKEEEGEEFKKLLTQDYDKAQEQLDKAYGINIIPLQFRNIQGIYYLYDYISTSNQGLSEALMQCNLDAIKQKLDNVIQQQGKAIIQQAQANVAIMKQNQQILETAQATMQNTAIGAKYAQIAAVNSSLALELDSKQLAYQKANFWLK